MVDPSSSETHMNLAQILWDSRPNFEHKPLLYVEGEPVSYDSFAENVRRLSGALKLRGVGRGDRVILAMQNSTEWLAGLIAVVNRGAICVPVNPGLRSPEMCNIATHCEPKLAIVDAELVDYFAPVSGRFGMIVRGQEGPDGWDTAIAEAAPANEVAHVAPTDSALIFYTSGTTGVPKGVLLSHAAENYTAEMTANHMQIGSKDVSIVMGSLAFIFPLVINTLAAVKAGASVVLQSRFHPQLAAEAVRKHRVTVVMGVPTMYVMLMNYAEENSTDFSSVRLALSGGANLPDALCRRGKERLGFEIFDLWGMTECTPVTSYDPGRDTRGYPDSCGRALPGCAFKIVDEDLNELPIGTVGEIMLTGPMIMSGYYRNPSATAETLIDGWIRSGDLGLTDADEHLFVVGRKKDLIIRGGANIYPVDIEEALYTFDDVAECAVIGTPDPVFGELVKAYVVKKTAQVTADQIIAHCRTKLADYKVPSEVEFVGELPKGPTGKILRRELRDMTTKRA
jgi:long-chain acyl-CoA synthetase